MSAGLQPASRHNEPARSRGNITVFMRLPFIEFNIIPHLFHKATGNVETLRRIRQGKAPAKWDVLKMQALPVPQGLESCFEPRHHQFPGLFANEGEMGYWKELGFENGTRNYGR